MQRDHWKLRQVETRYQFLFDDTSADPVMLADAERLHVVESNLAATGALGRRWART